METASDIIKRLNKAKSTDDLDKNRDLGQNQEDKSRGTKPRSRSFSSSSLPLRANYLRESFNPQLTAQQLDKSLVLLKTNKRGQEFDQCLYVNLYNDQDLNRDITAGCNFLVIDKDFLLSLKSKMKEREIYNPLQQAARVFVDVLWEEYLRPACEKLRLSANSSQIDFIIQAILNEFTASNVEDSKNAMLKETSEKLDSTTLFSFLKNQIKEIKYKEQLRKFRNMIIQAMLKKSQQIHVKNQVKDTELKIENFKVPNKGNFISETLFIEKFAKFLELDKKDLKNIIPIVFQSIRVCAKKGENVTLLHDLKEKQPLYFNDESNLSGSSDLSGLFIEIKNQFINILDKEVKIEKNNEIIKAINSKINNHPKKVEAAINSAITNWLKGLIQHNKKINPEKGEFTKEAAEETHRLSP